MIDKRHAQLPHSDTLRWLRLRPDLRPVVPFALLTIHHPLDQLPKRLLLSREWIDEVLAIEVIRNRTLVRRARERTTKREAGQTEHPNGTTGNCEEFTPLQSAS